jgi:DNA repair exonuclease SbcCD nuclease subunit
MTYEGVRDYFGRECRSLVSFRENKWQFGGLNVKGLEPFEVNVGQIGSETKSLQKISNLIGALDNLQFSDCQKRKKWHERLAKEKDESIRLEITRRLLDSEEKTYETVLEIVRLLKGTKSTVEDADTTLESNRLEAQLEELVAAL